MSLSTVKMSSAHQANETATGPVAGVAATRDVEQRHLAIDHVDRCLRDLSTDGRHFSNVSISERVDLLESCVHGVMQQAPEWVHAACTAKGIPHEGPCCAEEIVAGPLAVVRYLRQLSRTFRDINQRGAPRLPGRVVTGSDGRLRVSVLPAKGFCDSILLPLLKVHVRMQKDVTRENIEAHLATSFRVTTGLPSQIALILGAGNVSGIPATDALFKLFHENRLALLKMNPINDYLAPIFEQAFAPLVAGGFLRIVRGDSHVGAYAVDHKLVDEVHITGSAETHDTIVWGPAGAARDRRKRERNPLVTKRVTSELGNVSPWTIVPGNYSKRQLDFQAESVAASVMNNASFNCVATRILLTWRRWRDREPFLDRIERIFSGAVHRVAYYPGALDRYRRFSGREIGSNAHGTLPWTLLRDIDPAASPHLLNEESFACVLAEVSLEAESLEGFLRKAVAFMNTRLWGTLSATLTVPSQFRRRRSSRRLLQETVSRLEYGMIGINHWPGVLYALASPPWGAFPGRPLTDIQSGRGWVHNACLLEGIEQTILEGPLVLFPTPVWLPSQSDADVLAWRTLDFYHRASLRKLTTLSWRAIKGELSCATSPENGS